MTNNDLTKSERVYAELLKDHIKTVQEFVDKNITNDNPMPAKDIFAGLSGRGHYAKINGLSQDEFVNSLRINVKIGRICGIAPKRRWGYCRVDEADGKMTIPIGRKYRIYSVDNHNWALQKRNASNWISCAYWSRLDQALRGVARRMVNGELRTTAVIVKDLREAAQLVNDAEERIYQVLKGEADAKVE